MTSKQQSVNATFLVAFVTFEEFDSGKDNIKRAILLPAGNLVLHKSFDFFGRESNLHRFEPEKYGIYYKRLRSTDGTGFRLGNLGF